MKRVIIVLVLLTLPGIATAKTLFLDNSANVQNGCTAYNPANRTCSGGAYTAYTNPWDASQALQDGDVLNIRQGEYWSDVSGKSGRSWTWGSITLDGKNNLTIRNYQGEAVWVKGGSSKTSVVNHPNNAILLAGTNNQVVGEDYNLHFYGGVIVSGNGNVINGCDLSGGWDHQSPIGGDAWYDVIRFVDSVDAVVSDSKIHDNYNHGTATDASNKSLMIHERDQNTTVENCSFYNPVAGFVNPKYQSTSGTVQAVYRYNWFGPANNFGIAGSFNYHQKYLKFYQNIFNGGDAGYFHVANMDTQHFMIYNNTFYNTTHAMYSWSTASINGHQFFNNIIYVNSGTRFAIDFNEVEGTITGNYIDYNNYYHASGSMSWRHKYSTYSSLSSWQSHLGSGDSHSISTNPNFSPEDGVLDGSGPTDFKRSSYPANGRGGAYPSVMGAYVTGNEVIGLLNGKNYVAAPQNLRKGSS